jgi:hypothetical protein
MKRCFAILVVLVLSVSYSYAQKNVFKDTLILKSNDTIVCKLTYVDGNYLKYQEKSNDKVYVRAIPISNVQRIIQSPKSLVYLNHIMNEDGTMKPIKPKPVKVISKTSDNSLEDRKDTLMEFNRQIVNAGDRLQKYARKQYLALGFGTSGGAVFGVGLFLIETGSLAAIPVLIVGGAGLITAGVLSIVAISDIKKAGVALERASQMNPI